MLILLVVLQHWIGIHDEPENTIEKYIQDSFDFYIQKYFVRYFSKGLSGAFLMHDNTGIPLHVIMMKRRENKAEVYPLFYITYLTNNLSPDIISIPTVNSRN